MVTSGVMDLTGRVLAGRYRLLAPIGSGSSGRVYVGEDIQLRRRVAIKVLHPGLAEDSAFLKRFRAEAQTAASLHHPNIVTVHDWGEDGVPFMVLELLEGGSLRAILDQGERLSPAQAAYVCHRVATGLEYAHARGLVHRDIKPANLLFDEHGGVRIADFGLARALAEASWTEPAGALLGTARYAAPEQATGAQLDGRADLYALALVLVESVTGDPPAAGETALGALAARIGQPIVAPEDMGPLATVVEQAGRADPGARYADAAAMADAIAIAAQELPSPEPLTLVGLPSVISAQDPHPTEVGALDPIVVLDGSDDEPGDSVNGRRDHRRRTQGQTKRSRRFVPIVVLALALLALGGAAFAFEQARGPQVSVPSLAGHTEKDARAMAERAGLTVELEAPVISDDPPGTVVSQQPGPGSSLREGKAIHVSLSLGPPPVDLPDVSGKPEGEARQLLVDAGFEVDEVTRVLDEAIPKGIVISQDPPGANQAPRGSAIRMTVSDGPRPVPVPNVVGKTWEEAVAALKAAKLGATKVEQFSDSIAKGKVISHDPIPGQEAPRDSLVKVFVSKGPDLVKVPDVRGKTVEAATKLLEGLGFEVDVVGYKPGRVVRNQDPRPGELEKTGTNITLFL